MKVSKCDKIKKPKKEVNKWDIVTFIKVPLKKNFCFAIFVRKVFCQKNEQLDECLSHSLETRMVVSLASSRVLLVL